MNGGPPEPDVREAAEAGIGRLTAPLVKLLRVLLADPTSKYWGFEIMKRTGLASGTVYPLLARLEGMGWLESGWDDEPAISGRPRRRYYKLTGSGIASARVALAEANSKKRPASAPSRLRPALGEQMK
jgi:PadR family transcriptional regulator, regulatory protein PadR